MHPSPTPGRINDQLQSTTSDAAADYVVPSLTSNQSSPTADGLTYVRYARRAAGRKPTPERLPTESDARPASVEAWLAWAGKRSFKADRAAPSDPNRVSRRRRQPRPSVYLSG